MPSIVKSKLWFVRVDGNHEFLEKKFKELRQQPAWVDVKTIIAFLHMGDKNENPHTHFLISLESELQKQSFDVRIKKYFNIQKKSEYSSKVWDGGNEAIAYMYHENTEPVINIGFEAATLHQAKEHNTIVQKVIAVNKDKAGHKMLDKILVKINPDTELEAVIETAIDMVREGEIYYPGDYKFKSVCQEAYIKSRPLKEYEELRTSWASNLASDIKIKMYGLQ